MKTDITKLKEQIGRAEIEEAIHMITRQLTEAKKYNDYRILESEARHTSEFIKQWQNR